MFCLILLITGTIGYFIVAKNPIEKCANFYEELRKEEKKNIFEELKERMVGHE